MANPLTWTIISIVGAVGGAAMSAMGTIQQHKQKKANAEMQADQLNYNKRLEEREAAVIEAESAENARRQRIQAEQVKAQQRALLGKSGAAMNAGSPLAILGESALNEEMMIQDVHYKGYQQASQHKEQAKMYGYQAGVARSQAPSGWSLGLQLGSTAFETVEKVADKMTNYSKGKGK